MLNRLLYIVILVATFWGLAGCDKHVKDKAEIRSAYDQYQQGQMDANGTAVAAVFTQRTFDHYAKLVKIGMDAKAQDVWNLPPSDMYEVLRMRSRAKRSQLKLLNGRDYVLLATKEGWWSGGEPGWKIVEIKVTGTTAVGTVRHPEWEAEYKQQQVAGMLSRRARRSMGALDKPFSYNCQFVKEDGAWKVDETSMFPEFNRWLTEAAKESRRSVRDFLMMLESEERDQKLPMSIWDPMKK